MLIATGAGQLPEWLRPVAQVRGHSVIVHSEALDVAIRTHAKAEAWVYTGGQWIRDRKRGEQLPHL